MKNKLITNGIFKKGYGLISKLVMKDSEIDPEAKTIYAYICSYAGNGDTAFPGVKLMCNDLNMSRRRFYKYRKQLVEKDYIRIHKNRKDGRRANNVYEIVLHPEKQQLQNETVENETVENETVENDTTNNNSLNNNSLNNNSNNSNDDDESRNFKLFNKLKDHYCDMLSVNMVNTGHIDEIIKMKEKHNFDIDVVIKAMEETKLAKNPTMFYLRDKLQRWAKDGIKSLQDLEKDSGDIKIADF